MENVGWLHQQMAATRQHVTLKTQSAISIDVYLITANENANVSRV
jgi:hypothetical protein